MTVPGGGRAVETGYHLIHDPPGRCRPLLSTQYPVLSTQSGTGMILRSGFWVLGTGYFFMPLLLDVALWLTAALALVPLAVLTVESLLALLPARRRPVPL